MAKHTQKMYINITHFHTQYCQHYCNRLLYLFPTFNSIKNQFLVCHISTCGGNEVHVLLVDHVCFPFIFGTPSRYISQSVNISDKYNSRYHVWQMPSISLTESWRQSVCCSLFAGAKWLPFSNCAVCGDHHVVQPITFTSTCLFSEPVQQQQRSRTVQCVVTIMSFNW